MATWTSDVEGSQAEGYVIDLTHVSYTQKITWGTEDPPQEKNVGVIVFLDLGHTLTLRGADATSFMAAFNP